MPLRNANRQQKAKSTNAEPVVSRQLSPFKPGNSPANTGRSTEGSTFPFDPFGLSPAAEGAADGDGIIRA